MDTEQGASVLGETFVAFTTWPGDIVQLSGLPAADTDDRPTIHLQVVDVDTGKANTAQLQIEEAHRLYDALSGAITWAVDRVGLDAEEQARLYAEEARARRARTDAERAAAAEERRRRQDAELDERIQRFRERAAGAEQ